MEGIIMKKQPCNLSSSTSPPLSMHKDSQTISKVKPKIRIIQIFAPEIIKTDVENSRELVQRLTRKPKEKSSKKKLPKMGRREDKRQKNVSLCDQLVMTKNMEIRNGFGSFGSMERGVIDIEEMLGGADSGGYLSGFSKVDGFFQELEECPFMPMGLDGNHMQLHGF